MLDEGVRVALPEARTVGYVEREAFAQGILMARMADAALDPAPVWCGPLEDFKFGEWRGAVDCITAGFPCQPWSAAGKQQGESDDRWIWPAIRDGIRASEVPVVFLENVPGLVAGRGINRVLGDLAALGFDAEWCAVSAADVGASHLRERIFILAVDQSRGRGVLRESSERGLAQRRLADGSDAVVDDAVRILGGERSGRERVQHAGSTLADADGGQREQQRRSIALETGRVCGSDSGGESLPYSEDDGAGRREPFEGSSEGARGVADGGRERSQGLCESGPASGPVRRSSGADVLDTESDRRGLSEIFAPGPADARWSAVLAECPWLSPSIEPGVRCLVDGHAVVVDEHRADQLRAIGNGVVALTAGVAFAVLTRRFLEVTS